MHEEKLFEFLRATFRFFFFFDGLQRVSILHTAWSEAVRLLPSLITHLLLSFQRVLSEVYDLSWFTFYLSYSQHFISTEDNKSSVFVILGVAHGSALGLGTGYEEKCINHEVTWLSHVVVDQISMRLLAHKRKSLPKHTVYSNRYQTLAWMLFVPHAEPVHTVCLRGTHHSAQQCQN